MAAPPRQRLSGELAPDAEGWWKQRVLPALMSMLGEITAALDGRLTRRENSAGDWSDFDFTTGDPSYSSVVTIKNRMDTPPEHVTVSQLKRADGAELTTPWSVTWSMGATGTIDVKLQGLSINTRYSGRILYE